MHKAKCKLKKKINNNNALCLLLLFYIYPKQIPGSDIGT